MLKGTDNRITIGEQCRTDLYIFAGGSSTISIGSNFRNTGKTAIHAHEGSAVEVGDDCFFLQNVVFRPSDAHKIIDLNTGKRINPPGSVKVGNHCWVGEEVLFLKGAAIPNDCVVGARSIVTKKFTKPNSIIVGHPATLVKSDITWES